MGIQDNVQDFLAGDLSLSEFQESVGNNPSAVGAGAGGGGSTVSFGRFEAYFPNRFSSDPLAVDVALNGNNSSKNVNITVDEIDGVSTTHRAIQDAERRVDLPQIASAISTSDIDEKVTIRGTIEGTNVSATTEILPSLLRRDESGGLGLDTPDGGRGTVDTTGESQNVSDVEVPRALQIDDSRPTGDGGPTGDRPSNVGGGFEDLGRGWELRQTDDGQYYVVSVGGDGSRLYLDEQGNKTRQRQLFASRNRARRARRVHT